MDLPLITADEVQKHHSLDDLWTVVHGVIYDLTEFAPEHPGGPQILLEYSGRDATIAYNEVHSASLISTTLPSSRHIGIIEPSTVPITWISPAPQRRQSTAPSKPLLQTMINTNDFRLAASNSYTPKAWAFLSSAATDTHTHRRNASTYSRITLRPRILRDVSAISTHSTMLGQPMRTPIFCAPTSLGKVFHPSGEKLLARACATLGIPVCVSTSASFPLSDIVAAAADVGPASIFFQLYVDRNRARSEALLKQAAELGVKGLFLTVDAPVTGKREADERVRADESITSPMTEVRAKNDGKGGALGRVMGGYIDPAVTWEDIAWLRRCLPGVPIVLKGVQTCMDAMMAMEAGVEAVVVSNHGGRSLDTSPPTILALLELRKNCPEIFDRMEVFIDGGISRGTDIFKALCLGARAVGIGRGFLYGLNYGEEGIRRYVEILNDELETTMKMCGVTSLDQVHPGFLNTLALDHLVPVSDSNRLGATPRYRSRI